MHHFASFCVPPTAFSLSRVGMYGYTVVLPLSVPRYSGGIISEHWLTVLLVFLYALAKKIYLI